MELATEQGGGGGGGEDAGEPGGDRGHGHAAGDAAVRAAAGREGAGQLRGHRLHGDRPVHQEGRSRPAGRSVTVSSVLQRTLNAFSECMATRMFLFGSLMLIDVVLQEFDRSYGPGWQCIVGTDFGSFVTHHSGCFIYFGIGNLSILLFNGGAPQVDTPEQQGRLTALKAAVEA